MKIAQAAPDPAVIFASRCSGCHSVGRGEVVGPDLKGVTRRHDRDWLHRFITSSQTVIRSRDEKAVALFERYRRQVMPDHPLSGAEIDALLAFVEAGGPGAGDSEIRLASAASEAEVRRGRDLFLGRKPLVNGGAACIHCHTAGAVGAAGAGDPVAAGTLAPDLTRTYLKYQDWGLVRVLERPQLQLPLMSDLYGSRPLTHDEAYALSAFLCRAAHGKAVPIDRAAPSRTAAFFGFGGSVRIPTKPATHSDAKPATHSEARRPLGRSAATTRAHGWWRWPPWPPAVFDSVIFSSLPSVDLAVAAVRSCGNPGGGGRAARISKGCGKVRGWVGGGPELSMPRQIPQPGWGALGWAGGSGAAARALLMRAPPPARQAPGSCAATLPGA
jgi:mono/diheme cytochrome c family protein